MPKLCRKAEMMVLSSSHELNTGDLQYKILCPTSEWKGEPLTHKSGAICDGTNHPQELSPPKYWIIKGSNSVQHEFPVSKANQGISSTIEVKHLQNGSLLLEFDHSRQAQGISQLDSIPIRVTPHKLLNSCRDSIYYCRGISDMSEDHKIKDQNHKVKEKKKKLSCSSSVEEDHN